MGKHGMGFPYQDHPFYLLIMAIGKHGQWPYQYYPVSWVNMEFPYQDHLLSWINMEFPYQDHPLSAYYSHG